MKNLCHYFFKQSGEDKSKIIIYTTSHPKTSQTPDIFRNPEGVFISERPLDIPIAFLLAIRRSEMSGYEGDYRGKFIPHSLFEEITSDLRGLGS